MKILLTFIALFFAITLSSSGQTFIPKIGLSLSKIDGEDDTGVKTRVGVSLGMGVNFDINQTLSIQPELLFIQKGAKFDYSVSEPGLYKFSISGYIHINYLEVPVLFKANIPTNKESFKFYVAAGPSFGFGLGGKTQLDLYLDDGGTITKESGSGDVKFGDQPNNPDEYDAYVKRMDVGIQLGCGAIIKDKVIFDIRYGIGLTDVNEDEKTKNKVFQLTVGMPIQRSK